MILLDTHAFIWWVSDREELSPKARSIIETNYDKLLISVVSAWEIGLLHKKKRLELPMAPEEFIQRAIEHHSVIELPLKRQIILKAVGLPPIHNDPFDRVLVAEAQNGNHTLITKDTIIPEYPDLKTIW